MSIPYTLTDVDTIQGLALKYFGDATRWTEIADYNKLDYPYIADDSYSGSGSGYVHIIRANYTSSATIRAGWTFKTKPYVFLGGIVKVFRVTEDTVIPAGMPEAYIPVECTVPGTIGNVMAGFITEVGDDMAAYSGIQFLYVYNEEPLTGGGSSNVKKAGDTIYIPTSEDYMDADAAQEIATLGGEDFAMADDGLLVSDNYGDIASVGGIDNIQYAVKARLTTEKGELVLHPEYGHDLAELIGSARTPYTERLAEIRIIRTLSYEDRIENVVVNSLNIVETSVYVDLSYRVKLSGQTVNQQVTI